jgi:DNA-binding SARP family transcriptional activator
MMEIRMLGPLLVRRHDGSGVGDEEWRTSKTLDLLRLLALHNGEPVPVRRIVDLLWPGVPESRGRASLRTAASQMRKTIGDACVDRRIGGLVLVGAWVDVQAFEELLGVAARCAADGDHEGVVSSVKHAESLWVGDLDLPDNPGDWLYDVRERLHRLRCRALLDAAESAATVRWMRDSLAFAERAAALAPSEEASRALMRALAGVGEIEKALEVFEQTRHDLARDYGADPSPQTRALHVQLITGMAAPARRSEVVGHDTAVRALVDVLSSARDRVEGEGTLVWLEGEPRSGRDSVARAACRTAGTALHELGREVWFGHATDLAPTVAAVPASDVVLMPAVMTVQPGWMPALESLARRHGGTVVMPVRHVPVEGRRHPVVRVGALADDEITALAERVLQGTPSPALLARLRAASGGLSGAACRTAQTWLGEGRVVWSADGLELTDRPTAYLPAASLRVRRRLRMLSPFARDIVEVLAITQDETDAEEIVAVVGALHRAATPEQVQAALEQLVATEHVVPGWKGYRLRDDAVRAEFATWMRPTLRRRICVLVVEHVSLSLVRRVDLLVAAGEHERAVQLGRAALELAQRRGDTATQAALRGAMLSLPSRQRLALAETDRLTMPEPRDPAPLESTARTRGGRVLDRLHGLAGLVAIHVELQPLGLLLGA